MWSLGGGAGLIAAMAVCALAGTWKARAQAGINTATIGGRAEASPVKGMLLAIAGGVLSGQLSLGMSMEWARRVTGAAVEAGGARPENAANAVLLPILLGGCVPNCLYCLHLLRRNRTWSAYRERPAYWLVILLMGAMYSGSVVLWGISTSPAMLGPLGASVGWALFIGMIVVASNIGGFLAGEWRGAGLRASAAMACALVLIVAAMASIGFGNYLLNA
jgi:L-rhamnose-H+ transport protein